MDESGIYEESGTSGQQPNTESGSPDSYGMSSGSAAGPNKRDGVSANQIVGNTIAGRTTNNADGTREPSQAQPNSEKAAVTNPPSSGPDTSGLGVTGSGGRESGEGEGHSKGAAAENINPGDSKGGSIGEPESAA